MITKEQILLFLNEDSWFCPIHSRKTIGEVGDKMADSVAETFLARYLLG